MKILKSLGACAAFKILGFVAEKIKELLELFHFVCHCVPNGKKSLILAQSIYAEGPFLFHSLTFLCARVAPKGLLKSSILEGSLPFQHLSFAINLLQLSLPRLKVIVTITVLNV